MATTTSLPEVQPISGSPDYLVSQNTNGRNLPNHDAAIGLRLLLCAPAEGLDPVQAAYAQAIAGLLPGTIDVYSADKPFNELSTTAKQYDLVLMGEKRPSWRSFILGERAGRQAARKIGTSVLIMRRPRWPLRHLLFVCRAEPSDNLALPWVIQLAVAAETAVTLLVVVPCIPALYRLPGPYPLGLKTLLHPHTTSGQRIRRLLQNLADAEVHLRVHLRDGEPDEQIRQEAATELYDMIVMAGEGHGRLRHAVLGDLLPPMLSWLNVPLLLAKERLPLMQPTTP